MKLWLSIFLMFYSLTSFPQDRLYQAQDLGILLAESQINPKLKTERLISLEFHDLLNAYRVKNGCIPLSWNNTLWLAARNHNLNMIAQNKLSHNQTRGSKFFSGNEPQARLQFVQGRKGKLNFSGENCLISGYYDYDDNYDEDDEDTWYHEIKEPSFEEAIDDKEFITSRAQMLLKLWISSPPHHRNMLSRWHGSHGSSFVITDDNLIFGTDLFGERK